MDPHNDDLVCTDLPDPSEFAERKCTDECKQMLFASVRLREDYEIKWPNYCRACEGWGGISGYEDVAGDGRRDYPVFDICRACSEQDLCPRCALPVSWGDGAEICPHCKWELANADALPYKHECYCHEI